MTVPRHHNDRSAKLDVPPLDISSHCSSANSMAVFARRPSRLRVLVPTMCMYRHQGPFAIAVSPGPQFCRVGGVHAGRCRTTLLCYCTRPRKLSKTAMQNKKPVGLNC